MLGDVRQRLGHDEVGARLDGAGQPAHRHPDLDRQRHAPRERLHARAQPAVREYGREDAVRELVQLVDRVLRLAERLGDELDGIAVPALECPLRGLERDDRRSAACASRGHHAP